MSKAQKLSVGTRKRSLRRRLLDSAVLLVVLLGGLAASWYAYSLAKAAQEQRQHEQLGAAGQAVIEGFHADLVRAIEAVRATGLMVANQSSLPAAQFQSFAGSIMNNAPALTSLQWQPQVPAENLAAFEAAAQSSGIKDYRVVENDNGRFVRVRPRAHYTPIMYAYPEGSALLGFDPASLADRKNSNRLAQETGQPVGSKVIKLVSANPAIHNRHGLVITSAVNASSTIASAGAALAPPGHLLGFVAGLILVDDLFRESAFRAEAAYLDIQAFDLTSDPPQQLFPTDASESTTKADAQPEASASDLSLTVDVAGRSWEVVLRPHAQFYSGAGRDAPHWVLGGGIAGTLLLVLTIFITQRSTRRIAESQAQTDLAERNLRNIIEGTQAGTWEWDVPSGALSLNERWLQMFGYTRAELEPLSIALWQQLAHPDDFALAQVKLEQHFSGTAPGFDMEMRLRHKNGHWLWVLARGSLITHTPDGGPGFMAGTHMDISESKRLIQQVTDIRTALDAHAIVGITDIKGDITYANDKFCEVSQYSRAELLGQNHRLLNSGEHPPEFFADMWHAIATGHTWKGEIRNRAKGGHFYWVDTTVAPILGDDGLPAQYIAIRYEITEKKQHAESLLSAKEAAEAASRAKSDFLATMSHEIRTPMNGILGMLKLLEHTELSAQQHDYTEKAEGATKALLGIINDILDFSKVEAGKLELDCRRFELSDLLRDLSVVLSANLGQKDLEVLFVVAPDVPKRLVGDPLRLRQILLNLAGNALKFTEQGEVVLGIRQTQRTPDYAELEFSVRDTGIGIAADKLGYIFEGFSQAESSTTRRFGGTGLGLAISKRLVALMGGELQVDSQLGQGSFFSFKARFEVMTDAADAATTDEWASSREPVRVLVVDDNALARGVLLQMANSMGWQCDAVHSGEAALAKLSAADRPGYQVVLMDWRMPGIDGWETTRRLRIQARAQLGKAMPAVIMVTATSREQLAEKSTREIDLIDGYLVKPITASMLYDAVMDATAEKPGPVRKVRAQQGSDRLAGLRLLVVEDNLLNQQVAKELLQRSGAEVEIAGGGLDGVSQALAAMAAGAPFDAILMDVQMPDIDGLEATRRILAQATGPTGPIIAMTANAMDSDKEACRAAGMVDHVGKPIDLDLLVATILRHVGRKERNDGQRVPPHQPPYHQRRLPRSSFRCSTLTPP
ncbi:MAG: response regulator [Rhodocyclaceae bacterium]|nr:response regulator [Rhodocyclaceae bacterium]